MSTDVRTTTVEMPACGQDGLPRAGGPNGPTPRDSHQSLIQESIKYRRRAQEAERRAEALEAELQNLKQTHEGRTQALESELAQTRADADAMRRRLETIEQDRLLERELARAGCADLETGLALARERMSGAVKPPDDLAAFARGLLDEKPYLRGNGVSVHAAAGAASLPPQPGGPRTSADTPHRRTVDRLADRARQTGSPKDVLAYMRARRGAGT